MGRYFGIVGLKMEYKGQYGQEFKLLHIDPDTLKNIVEDLDLKFKILHHAKEGDYLAKISK